MVEVGTIYLLIIIAFLQLRPVFVVSLGLERHHSSFFSASLLSGTGLLIGT
jgi:hypothetical protein